MNKTEYMNTLRQELQGLPCAVVTETVAHYEKQFADGLASGKTEAEVIAQLPNPRLLAAQKRANVRFQNLKNDFSLGNVFSLFIAGIGLVIFNFFMLIPAFVYGSFLFVAYLSSLVIYGAGIVTFAASVSGVPQMEFKLPTHHHRVYSSENHRQYQHREGAVTINISETGLTVDKGMNRSGVVREFDTSDFSRLDKHANTITIKNKMQMQHTFLGIGLLLLGTCLLLACVWMTRWSVIGFGKYLMWNVNLLRSTVRSEPAHA